MERLGQLSDLEALSLEGNPLALAPGSEREYRLRVFAVLRPPPRAGGGDGGEEPKPLLLLDGRGMDIAEAEELTRRMGPVYDAPLVVAKPAATPPMTERVGDDGAASAFNGSGTPPGTTNDGSAPATAMPPPPPPLPPPPAITIPPPPASPSSVSSAGSASLARGASSLASVASSGGGGNGRRSRFGTPTTPGGSSKTRTVKGADGRARRVAMVRIIY